MPLARLRLPLSALVVGSMAPDFLYFIQFSPRGHFGHTLPGLFVFCIPVGLGVLWIFHCLIKRPLLALCPIPVQRRLLPRTEVFRFSPFRRLVPVVVSVLAGALTHVTWDAFTHEGGWGLILIPALHESVNLGFAGSVPAYKLAQHGSTLIGFAILALWTSLWWRGAREVEVQPAFTARIRLVRLFFLAAFPVAVGAVYASTVAAASVDVGRVFAGRFVIATTSVAFVELAVYGMGTWCSSDVSGSAD